MVLGFWAATVAAIGWFSFGTLVAQHARTNEQGKIPTPARYVSRRGAAVEESTWKTEEAEPPSFGVTILLAVVSLASLLAPWIPWGWLAIAVLSILSLVTVVLLGAVLSDDVLYYREVDREDNADGTANITYKLDSPFPAKRATLVVLALVVFWLPAYWLLGRFGFDRWVTTGVLLAGMAAMVGFMYLKAKLEQKRKAEFDFDYCKRCGHRLKRAQTYGPVETTNVGGDRYAVRNDTIITETCTLCGYQRVL